MLIKSYKKLRNGKYSVLLDNDIKVLLYEDAILEKELLRKKEITEKELNEIISLNEKYEVYIKSVKFLSSKMRSEKEIRQKFNMYNKLALDYAISKLEKEGYLNKDAYIKAFINDQINLKNIGPLKIKNELINKGLNELEFINYLNSFSKKIWLDKISKIIKKEVSSNRTKSNSMLVIKITNELINKGFEKSMINEEINKIEFSNDFEILKKDLNKLYKKYEKKYSNEELKYQLLNKLWQKGYDKEKIMKALDEINS